MGLRKSYLSINFHILDDLTAENTQEIRPNFTGAVSDGADRRRPSRIRSDFHTCYDNICENLFKLLTSSLKSMLTLRKM